MQAGPQRDTNREKRSAVLLHDLAYVQRDIMMKTGGAVIFILDGQKDLERALVGEVHWTTKTS